MKIRPVGTELFQEDW